MRAHLRNGRACHLRLLDRQPPARKVRVRDGAATRPGLRVIAVMAAVIFGLLMIALCGKGGF